jgi:hypothetical protein
MNAVKTSVLLIVFWLLLTAIPCYAATAPMHGQTPALSLETVSEDHSNLLRGNLEPIGNSTQIGNASESTWATESLYSIQAHVRRAEINPGDTVEIEIYLSGYGIPLKNKLTMVWSSPYVIDENDPGKVTTMIKNYDINSEILTLGLTDIPLKRAGNISGETGEGLALSLGYFAHPVELPPGNPQYGFKSVMGEWNWNGNPPILVSLNTRRDTPGGGYQVALTFTYGNETNLKQDFKIVEFHVKSSWERWEPRLVVAGAVIAFIALIITAAGTIWQMVRWHRGQ